MLFLHFDRNLVVKLLLIPTFTIVVAFPSSYARPAINNSTVCGVKLVSFETILYVRQVENYATIVQLLQSHQYQSQAVQRNSEYRLCVQLVVQLKLISSIAKVCVCVCMRAIYCFN